MTEIEWATTSCSSRAIRDRSSATASNDRCSCSAFSAALTPLQLQRPLRPLARHAPGDHGPSIGEQLGPDVVTRRSPESPTTSQQRPIPTTPIPSPNTSQAPGAYAPTAYITDDHRQERRHRVLGQIPARPRSKQQPPTAAPPAPTRATAAATPRPRS